MYILYMHTYTHTSLHSLTQAQTQTQTQKHTHTYIRITLIHKFVHTCMRNKTTRTGHFHTVGKNSRR
jgi:hypothetical protein